MTLGAPRFTGVHVAWSLKSDQSGYTTPCRMTGDFTIILHGVVSPESRDSSPIVRALAQQPHLGGSTLRVPLSSEFSTNKPVKARFWAWLEPFPGKSVLTLESCSLFAWQRLRGDAGLYKGTSFIRKCLPPQDFHWFLGTVLLKGPKGVRFLMSEVPLYQG